MDSNELIGTNGFQFSQIPPDSHTKTRLQDDPQFDFSVVELFMQFAKDYFHTLHFSQRHVQDWKEFVASLSEETVSRIFVGKLSELVKSGGISDPRKKTVRNRKCEFDFCRSSPCWGFEGTFPRLCENHKLKGMLYMPRNKTVNVCCALGCPKDGFFGYIGKEERFCITHKLDNMMDVRYRRCEEPTCPRRAYFNYQGELVARLCSHHSLIGMKNVKGNIKKCEEPTCPLVARFNHPKEKIPRFCSYHSLIGMTIVGEKSKKNRKVCESGGCRQKAIFNFAKEKRGRFCAVHKLRGMILISKTSAVIPCEIATCISRACFGFEGEKPRFCKAHAAKDMFNLLVKRCEEPGCTSMPVYGAPNERRMRFCNTHKKEGMLYFKHGFCHSPKCSNPAEYLSEQNPRLRCCASHPIPKMKTIASFQLEKKLQAQRQCQQSGCERVAAFSFEGEKFGTFCWEHSLVGMVCVAMQHRYCSFKGCTANSRYWNPGEKQRYCTKHKLPGMQDTRKVFCEHPGCKLGPSFNFRGEKKRRFCFQHKLPGMVSKRTQQCQHPGCEVCPTFGYEGSRTPIACQRHKLPTMVSLTRRKTCEEPSCGKLPTYNYAGLIARRFCLAHKLDGMVSRNDITHKLLISQKKMGVNLAPGPPNY